MQIYLDSCATTAPHPEVVKLVQEIMKDNWGNPSSLHFWGERSAMVLEKARFSVASLLNADSGDNIIFTSGGTEADNLAIFGTVYNYSQPQHIIISSVEHSAIASPVTMLEKQGWQVTRLPVNREGRVNPDDLRKSLRDNTVLVSIIYGQSEVGTIQPITELADITKTHSKALFHTDAVQIMGRYEVDVSALKIDLLSLSGHKFYGMQGAGALYTREGIELQPLIGGGGQELGLRSGTQALCAIAALGLASQLAQKDLESESLRLRELRDYFIDLVEQECPYLQLTGDRYYRLPHHASFIINHPHREITGRKMVRDLNLASIGISAGSACSSGKSLPSPTLLAMGYSETEALRGIRISCDRTTTKEDLEWVVMVINQLMSR
ncbi:cysteine desulfurase family protein [Cyanobacterium aponinum UTEX 3221]|uniref:cysteine desulfurase family protein n=1 Tax=Cyanobacterium aponinum TaxID=379064 RepID=UPI002B4C226F|nr:cysteine desulfurase family protein [Cyanobacterium aponinum]WRL37814.1 cysteine desulfurase family protein [Cyanobacterium aponinum UTEX 3221]